MRHISTLSTQARWRLAAAYALTGQKEVASDLIATTSTQIEEKQKYYSYGSVTRDQAMILETLSLLGDLDKAAPLMKEVAEKLSGESWLSTQTTAYSLIALSQLAQNSGSTKLSCVLNGNKITSDKPVYQEELPSDMKRSGEVKITNKAEGVLFARLVLEGIPFKGDTVNESSNLKLSVKYTLLNGEPIDVERISQGTDFMAVVTVSHPGQLSAYSDMALTQIFPSGWEIRNTRMEDVNSPYEVDMPDYKDIRDDRVYSYFNLERNQSKTFIVLLNASYQGKFYLPSVSCEAMYNNQITARRSGKWVEVVSED